MNMLKIKIANTFVEIIDSNTNHVVCSNYNISHDSKNVADNYEKLLRHVGFNSYEYKVIDCRS